MILKSLFHRATHFTLLRSLFSSNKPNQQNQPQPLPPVTDPAQLQQQNIKSSPSKKQKTAYEFQTSVQRMLGNQQFANQYHIRLSQLQQQHKQLRLSLNEQISLPYTLCGISRDSFKQTFSYMPTRVMSYYNIHEDTVKSYLLKIYKASLYAIVDRNTSFMEQYWQQNMQIKTMKALQDLDKKRLNLKLQQSRQYLDEVQQQCKIVDSIMIRGLSMNRDENKPPAEYFRREEEEEVGLITYTPMYLTYDNEAFINPETNKTIYKGYEKMVLRVLLLVKSPVRLVVSEFPVSEQINTFEHLVLFQNQMQAPQFLQSEYKYETLMQWLSKYRFGQWRIADIDMFMRSNNLFSKHLEQDRSSEIQVFKGTFLDKSYFAQIRKF